jgi:hypothetical protein
MAVQTSGLAVIVIAQTPLASPSPGALSVSARIVAPPSTTAFATPRPTSTPCACGSTSDSLKPSLEDDVLGWTWVALFISAAVIALVYGVRYAESMYRTSERRRARTDLPPEVDEQTLRHRRSPIVIFILIGTPVTSRA